MTEHADAGDVMRTVALMVFLVAWFPLAAMMTTVSLNLEHGIRPIWKRWG